MKGYLILLFSFTIILNTFGQESPPIQKASNNSVIGTWSFVEKELFGKKLKSWDSLIFFQNGTYKSISFTRAEGPAIIVTGNWSIQGGDTIKWKVNEYAYEDGSLYKYSKRLLRHMQKGYLEKFNIYENKLHLYWGYHIYVYNRS